MNIKNRIRVLEGFKKEALNFKTFEKIWPSVVRESDEFGREWVRSNNIDARTAFDLYRKMQLPSVFEYKLNSLDRQFSLTNINPERYDFPKSISSDPSVLADWRAKGGYIGEYTKRRIRESNERAAEIMLSGRHDSGQARSDRYVAPTTITGYDPQSGAPLHGLGEKGKEIKTVIPQTGELPLLNKEEFSKPGTVWAPYMLIYRGTQGVVSKQYENPNEARWVSSHPDVATGYARGGGAGRGGVSDGIIEIYDIRKIPKEKRSLFSQHIMTDSRAMSPDEIMDKTFKTDATLWSASPFYEIVISDKELHESRIAKYKALPGVGWMLVEGKNILKDGLSPDEAEEHRKIFEEEAKNLIENYPQMYFYYGIDGTPAGITPEMEIAALNNVLENNPIEFLSRKLYSNIKTKKNKEYLAKVFPQKIKEYFRKLANKDPKYFVEYEQAFSDIIKDIENKDSNKYIIEIKDSLLNAYRDNLSIGLTRFSEQNPLAFYLGGYNSVARSIGAFGALTNRDSLIEETKKVLQTSEAETVLDTVFSNDKIFDTYKQYLGDKTVRELFSDPLCNYIRSKPLNFLPSFISKVRNTDTVLFILGREGTSNCFKDGLNSLKPDDTIYAINILASTPIYLRVFSIEKEYFIDYIEKVIKKGLQSGSNSFWYNFSMTINTRNDGLINNAINKVIKDLESGLSISDKTKEYYQSISYIIKICEIINFTSYVEKYKNLIVADLKDAILRADLENILNISGSIGIDQATNILSEVVNSSDPKDILPFCFLNVDGGFRSIFKITSVNFQKVADYISNQNIDFIIQLLSKLNRTYGTCVLSYYIYNIIDQKIKSISYPEFEKFIMNLESYYKYLKDFKLDQLITNHFKEVIKQDPVDFIYNKYYKIPDIFSDKNDLLMLAHKVTGNKHIPPPPGANIPPPPTANIPPPPGANISTDSMIDITKESYLKNSLTKLSRALELMGLGKEAWSIIKLANEKGTLGELIEVGAIENPDFYFQRQGSLESIGKVSKKLDKKTDSWWGVKVKDSAKDKLDSNYLYYVLMQIGSSGYWKGLATGTTNLQSIRKKDLLSIPIG